MFKRRSLISFAAFAALALTAGAAWALGFQLGETKEQLKLKYEVSAQDHGTGRVTVVLELADEGRLKPLSEVELHVPGEDKTGFVDLAVPMALREENGEKVARVHLKRDLAERAEIWLKTGHLDGKQSPLTWYWHPISLGRVLKDVPPKKN